MLWIIFAVLLFCGILGLLTASETNKNAAIWGLLLGLFLGPIGVIVALVLKSWPACPACERKLKGQPKNCPHCAKPIKWSCEVEPDGTYSFHCEHCQTKVNSLDLIASVTCSGCGENVTPPSPPQAMLAS